MKLRKKAYGDCNMVGRNIEWLRKAQGIKQKDFISKMQVMGLDINPTSYSKLEGAVAPGDRQRSLCDRQAFGRADPGAF